MHYKHIAKLKRQISKRQCPVCEKSMGMNSQNHFKMDRQHRLFWVVWSRFLYTRRTWSVRVSREEQFEADRLVKHMYDDYIPNVFMRDEQH
jgi:hypothetical protein